MASPGGPAGRPLPEAPRSPEPVRPRAALPEAPQSPKPVRPRLPAGLMYVLNRALRPNPANRSLARWLEGVRWANRLFTSAEHVVKKEVFGCVMCGQCALPVTGYACPMTCPKQLRNGPCGGVGADGSCEVYPELRCVWLEAVERAAGSGHSQDLLTLHRPVDHRAFGQSAWVNYWQGRDAELWTADPRDAAIPAASPGPAEAGSGVTG